MGLTIACGSGVESCVAQRVDNQTIVTSCDAFPQCSLKAGITSGSDCSVHSTHDGTCESDSNCELTEEVNMFCPSIPNGKACCEIPFSSIVIACDSNNFNGDEINEAWFQDSNNCDLASVVQCDIYSPNPTPTPGTSTPISCSAGYDDLIFSMSCASGVESCVAMLSYESDGTHAVSRICDQQDDSFCDLIPSGETCCVTPFMSQSTFIACDSSNFNGATVDETWFQNNCADPVQCTLESITPTPTPIIEEDIAVSGKLTLTVSIENCDDSSEMSAWSSVARISMATTLEYDDNSYITTVNIECVSRRSRSLATQESLAWDFRVNIPASYANDNSITSDTITESLVQVGTTSAGTFTNTFVSLAASNSNLPAQDANSISSSLEIEDIVVVNNGVSSDDDDKTLIFIIAGVGGALGLVVVVMVLFMMCRTRTSKSANNIKKETQMTSVGQSSLDMHAADIDGEL